MPLPLNFYEASRLFPHRMTAPGRHNGQSDKRFVRLSLRWSLTLSYSLMFNVVVWRGLIPPDIVWSPCMPSAAIAVNADISYTLH